MDLFSINPAASQRPHRNAFFVEVARSAPLSISPWVAMSALQKAIRRDEPHVGLSAASTLLDINPQRLWRRLTAICFEDIGFGDVETVRGIVEQIDARTRRAVYGDDWTAAAAFVVAMCSAIKDRSADDLLIAAANHPALADARKDILSETIPRQLERISEPGALLAKAIAAGNLSGARREQREATVSVPTAALWDALEHGGCENQLRTLCRAGHRKTREALPVLLAAIASARHLACPSETAGTPIVDDDGGITPSSLLQSGVPVYALDMFSREGKAVIYQFLRGRSETARWVRDHIQVAGRAAFLGGLLFRVESGLVRRRRRTMLGDKLRELADTGFHGLVLTDPYEPLRLMRSDLPILDTMRHDAARRDH